MRSIEIRLRKLKLRLRDKRFGNHKAPCTAIWQQPFQSVLALRSCSATDLFNFNWNIGHRYRNNIHYNKKKYAALGTRTHSHMCAANMKQPTELLRKDKILFAAHRVYLLTPRRFGFSFILEGKVVVWITLCKLLHESAPILIQGLYCLHEYFTQWNYCIALLLKDCLEYLEVTRTEYVPWVN